MTLLAGVLVAILVVWMVICTLCGFHGRAVGFVIVLVAGLGMNLAWMMLALDARPLEPDALMAQAAITLCGLSASGFGWLIGRVSRAWRESAVS